MQDRPNRYLEQKPGGWFINKRLPRHLQEVFATASVRRALHTQDVVVARQRRDVLLETLEAGEPYESLLSEWKIAGDTPPAPSPAAAQRGNIVVPDFANATTRSAQEIEADCLRALERLDAMDSIIERLSERLTALNAGERQRRAIRAAQG